MILDNKNSAMKFDIVVIFNLSSYFFFKGKNMINIAINGFGRIGKNVARILLESKEYQTYFNLVAINDLGDTKIQAHLLKHDSVHGSLSQNISLSLIHISEPTRRS